MSWIRCFVISFEAGALVLLVLFWLLFPNAFSIIEPRLSELNWYPVIPAGGLAAFCGSLAFGILLPRSKHHDAYIAWLRYPEVRTTVLCGIVFAGLGVGLVALGVFFATKPPRPGLAALLVACGFVINAITTLSMLHAKLCVLSITDGGR